MDIILYGNFISQPFRSILLYMDYLKIKYKFEDISFDPESLNKLEKINPQKKLPILKYGDEIIYESTSIIRFISKKYKNDLYPIDDFNKILKIEEYFQTHHTRIRSLTLLVFLEVAQIENCNHLKTLYKEKNINTLEFIENNLLKNEFLIDNKISIADIFLANEIFQLNLLNFNLDKFPKIIEFIKKINNFCTFNKNLSFIKEVIKSKNIEFYLNKY